MRSISHSFHPSDSSNALCSLYAEGPLWARNVRLNAQWTLCALWEKNLPSVREKPPQRLAWVLSYREGAFYFSQIYTEEQNTQRPTETLSQPISQNLTAIFSYNVLWSLYAGGLLWVRNCAQKCSVNSVRSVRDKTPLRVVCVLSHREGAFYFSQKYTDEQNTQHSTETLSQPISQNLTATFSYNVLWYLYAGGVLWVRNCAQKGSVKSVSSVRERTPQRVTCVSSHSEGAFYFSQKNTEEQNTQRPTETLSQPISQNVTATEASPPCLTPFKNMPFSIREHALLRPRTRPSWCLTRPFSNVVCNLLISCRLQRQMKHTFWTRI